MQQERTTWHVDVHFLAIHSCWGLHTVGLSVSLSLLLPLAFCAAVDCWFENATQCPIDREEPATPLGTNAPWGFDAPVEPTSTACEVGGDAAPCCSTTLTTLTHTYHPHPHTNPETANLNPNPTFIESRFTSRVDYDEWLLVCTEAAGTVTVLTFIESSFTSRVDYEAWLASETQAAQPKATRSEAAGGCQTTADLNAAAEGSGEN